MRTYFLLVTCLVQFFFSHRTHFIFAFYATIFSLYHAARLDTFARISQQALHFFLTFHSLFLFSVCLWFALDNIRINTREMLFLLSKSVISYCVMCKMTLFQGPEVGKWTMLFR
jgi:hypothetical protein